MVLAEEVHVSLGLPVQRSFRHPCTTFAGLDGLVLPPHAPTVILHKGTECKDIRWGAITPSSPRFVGLVIPSDKPSPFGQSHAYAACPP